MSPEPSLDNASGNDDQVVGIVKELYQPLSR
jgi:hypothetical protein